MSSEILFVSPSPELEAGVARVTGRRPVSWTVRTGGGYTMAHRLIVQFADGGDSVFVKAAASEDTLRWIRQEQQVYERLHDSSFLPRYYGGEPGSESEWSSAFLVLEDLSAAHWPPPWTPKRVEAVVTALNAVHFSASRFDPASLPTLADAVAPCRNWSEVAADPDPFLSLKLCSSDWLKAALPSLLAAAAALPVTGNDLLHLDVRSDNICFRANGTAVLVDWNWACIGNGTVDIAGWLSSLHVEGGPPPETVLPHAPECAAWFAGFWAAAAGLPPPAGAPRVREIQRRQLTVTLPWAARALRLPPPNA